MLAWAKINLGLEVDPVDASGFHPIRTVMAEISLADELRVEPSSSWHMEVSGDFGSCPPDPRENLVWRAEQLLADGHRRSMAPFRVRLQKSIPAGAGLGGGSADAAAWLRYRDPHDLASADAIWQAAAILGKDIPFFRHGGVQVVSGYGEILRPLKAPNFRPYVLVAHPGWALPTAAVYQAFDRIPGAHQPLTSLAEVEDTLGQGAIPECLANQLEPAAHRVAPSLRDFSIALSRWSEGLPWWLAGSGSAYYILIAEEDKARWLFDSIKRRVPRTWLSQVMPKRPAMERG
ncbi:MAG: hypothetical protein M1415_02160 [Firmicutes bacterium]|nr:hypothetical protein [Bacillota bacterium]MCL5064237.1 hypothetical protein [Bacillota bacterium]